MFSRYDSNVEYITRHNHGDVTEISGFITGSRDQIPYVMWLPGETPAERIVLVGHGAAGDKREDYVTSFARHIATRYKAIVVSIDGPVHGDRREALGLTSSQPFLDFVAAWSSNESLTDDMMTDWTETLNAVFASGHVQDDAKVAYWGLSMGTILGLPFVASEPRVSACVLGLMGATGPTRERVVSAARDLKIPTMFLMQWHDQFFARDDALALFDSVGSTVKTLMANPGVHGAVPPHAFDASARFLLRHI
jgi:dienelactone hydrolase